MDEDKPESREYLLGPEYPPYFLIVLDHPSDYYPIHFGPFSGSNYNNWGVRNGIGVLQDPDISDEEKSLAIFGMSQLYSDCYAELILYACDWYKQGLLTVQHLYQLFVCDFPTFYKYPFFILDYKNEYVQVALDEFIGLPMIPCGLREIAKKVKEGKLATKKEMDYMEGYRTFRKTYFTLYESIPSSK